MPEIFSAALALPGLSWLFGIVIVAGVVRGFSGFGSAMIIMPVASSVLDPVAALVFLTMTDLVGPLPILPRALKEGNRPDAVRLGIGAAVAMPIGILSLSYMSQDTFGWVVTVTVFVLLAILVTGWRYQGVLTPRLVLGTGALGGFMSGATGMAGPPVIMLYMASTLRASVIRANLILYLLTIDLLMIATIWVYDLFVLLPAVVGLAFALPYMLANLAGAALFRPSGPSAEVWFRRTAYVMIAGAALMGLPLWS